MPGAEKIRELEESLVDNLTILTSEDEIARASIELYP